MQISIQDIKKKGWLGTRSRQRDANSPGQTLSHSLPLRTQRVSLRYVSGYAGSGRRASGSLYGKYDTLAFVSDRIRQSRLLRPR